ncbi:hypothetical protein TVNIR_2896 [Thioalkalivibrio nitratireducens DSM 14787]|uniref:Uncharacterized protein n=1 Tax=Thioalkalivibrio nitratireducens (strain DSM 14787 / UNIQEM 213 / ALEN2) TaxID=1255043 RepID=L0E000_THIND|nr:hypothetical protein TVNIR_2896 [Thioalkalivibrio nitratireducens DSM 14787]
MLTRPTRWWLCTQATDMRKSFDGLSALVRNRLGTIRWMVRGSCS